MGVLLQMPTTSSPRPHDGFEKQFTNGAWRIYDGPMGDCATYATWLPF